MKETPIDERAVSITAKAFSSLMPARALNCQQYSLLKTFMLLKKSKKLLERGVN
jgi:hypothetical protein